MLPLCETYGIRCIASDRRGFGKSDWNTGRSQAITYDTFARDTIDVIEESKIGKFFFVASSMGCGETLLSYLRMKDGFRGQCLGFVWLGPSLPLPLKTETNPLAPSRELWDMILTSFRQDRAGFTRSAIPGVFGVPFNIGIEVPEPTLQKFEGIVDQADALAIERCVQIITDRDFTKDLERLDGCDVKLLVIHGDNDQSKALPSHRCLQQQESSSVDSGMPAEASANLIPHFAKQAEVKIYEKAAHGLYLTHAEKILEDIIAFVFGKPGGR